MKRVLSIAILSTFGATVSVSASAATFPLCSEVIKNSVKAELYQLADSTSIGSVRQAALELAQNPQSMIAELERVASINRPEWDDRLERVEHPRREARPPQPWPSGAAMGGCFASNTKVTKLSADHQSDELVRIFDINPGDKILSSTRVMFANQDYQFTCWADVKEVKAFRLSADAPDSGAFSILGISGAAGHEEIMSTLQHPFYGQSEAGWDWMTAGNLNNGTRLSSMFDANPSVKALSVVTSTRTTSVAAFNREAMTVYDLDVTPTHVYFIGANQVLVHNRKQGQ